MPLLQPTFLYFILSTNALTYLLYAYDKHAARQSQHKQRIPERHLHLLALIGGWPAALLAQQQLRHKNKKDWFVQLTWLLAILNVVGMFGVCWVWEGLYN
jgi:uncharacterized membrane protein YsdA (DUF1294 family)